MCIEFDVSQKDKRETEVKNKIIIVVIGEFNRFFLRCTIGFNKKKDINNIYKWFR